jgi:RNA polymerase sigma-70 factor (ECF subfamily)
MRQNPPAAHQVFEILVREHAGMLTAFLRSLVFRSDIVDDLFQETMLVAWRRLGECDTSRPFGPWLRGIAAHLVMEHRRKTATRGMLPVEPDLLAALEAEFDRFEKLPGDSFQDRLARLRACLDRLPPLMRDALDMAYVKGMPLRALAVAVEATEEAIKKRVQRARQLLADCIGGGP